MSRELKDLEIKEILDKCDSGQESSEYLLSFARAVIAADRALRVPMTPEQVQALLHDTAYISASHESRADFINGIRHGERFHGIGEKA